MLCQNCKEKPSSVHFVKIVNGVRQEMHLCEKCAHLAHQQMPAAMNFDITVGDIINSFIGGAAAVPQLQCPRCGMTFSQFGKDGKLGCNSCFDAFSNSLDSTMKQIHGAVSHAGKLPKRAGAGELRRAQLKKELEKAIATEDFESAARIRDELKSQEEGGDGK